MRVITNFPGSGRREVEVGDTDITVCEFKVIIRSTYNIHPSVDLSLLVNATPCLKEDQRLSDYNITSESTVTVMRPIVSTTFNYFPALFRSQSSSSNFSQPSNKVTSNIRTKILLHCRFSLYRIRLQRN
jgi:hypothetical protein